MRMKKTIALCAAWVLLGTLIVGPLALAGPVDDWLTQKSETAPGYFEGQKRGYYTAGSFSARWPQGNDYLMSITPPKVKSGCGGIDAFMGGFSFLNVDYLVQKLQRMIQAAPAVAFDIALKVLTQEMPETLGKFENIINKLNNIQLDECKGGKALLATIAKTGFGDTKKGDFAAMQGDFLQSMGIKDNWTDTTKEAKANNDNPTSNAMADPSSGVTSGCTQEVKDIFGETGSVMEKLGAKFGSSAYVDLIRGMVGDVYVQKTGDGLFTVAYKSSCEQNKKMSVDNFVDGKAYAMNSSWNCYQITDANKNLSKWATDKMISIATKLKSKNTAPDADDLAFMNTNPLPVGLVLKYAVGTNQEGAVLGTLADVTARAYAFAIVSDFYNKVVSITEKARQLASSQRNATPGAKAVQCQVEMFSDAPEKVAEIEAKTYEMMQGVRASYAAFAGEVNAIMTLTEKLQNFDKLAQRYLTARFGAPVANRAMGK